MKNINTFTSNTVYHIMTGKVPDFNSMTPWNIIYESLFNRAIIIDQVDFDGFFIKLIVVKSGDSNKSINLFLDINSEKMFDSCECYNDILDIFNKALTQIIETLEENGYSTVHQIKNIYLIDQAYENAGYPPYRYVETIYDSKSFKVSISRYGNCRFDFEKGFNYMLSKMIDESNKLWNKKDNSLYGAVKVSLNIIASYVYMSHAFKNVENNLLSHNIIK